MHNLSKHTSDFHERVSRFGTAFPQTGLYTFTIGPAPAPATIEQKTAPSTTVTTTENLTATANATATATATATAATPTGTTQSIVDRKSAPIPLHVPNTGQKTTLSTIPEKSPAEILIQLREQYLLTKNKTNVLPGAQPTPKPKPKPKPKK
jgi:hypothetical protein